MWSIAVTFREKDEWQILQVHLSPSLPSNWSNRFLRSFWSILAKWSWSWSATVLIQLFKFFLVQRCISWQAAKMSCDKVGKGLFCSCLDTLNANSFKFAFPIFACIAFCKPNIFFPFKIQSGEKTYFKRWIFILVVNSSSIYALLYGFEKCEFSRHYARFEVWNNTGKCWLSFRKYACFQYEFVSGFCRRLEIHRWNRSKYGYPDLYTWARARVVCAPRWSPLPLKGTKIRILIGA